MQLVGVRLMAILVNNQKQLSVKEIICFSNWYKNTQFVSWRSYWKNWNSCFRHLVKPDANWIPRALEQRNRLFPQSNILTQLKHFGRQTSVLTITVLAPAQTITSQLATEQFRKQTSRADLITQLRIVYFLESQSYNWTLTWRILGGGWRGWGRMVVSWIHLPPS